ncbi:magnesium/cobalt transporter CorA [Staphylococcus aureus]|uniref:magnesium/cobalt transporter CorA n=1 Tax=Staphylococcus aureus TaxID=1280 RepID=UPI0006BAB4CB|nr:magnesium/cobalt transporter CorA [Staphylococcus aureus]MEB6819207.1 magnesium/cobalt transporter CorA [Staphylococcus aureus]NWG89418.1 magnesium/cobalt transporter CorA [Staphylococcus aureus]QNU55264.1 magnesium/cobalt transporter CorA [Staphylococcus aureus]QNU57259.1 magnesium/cobalt transporter CorA [Staphylococcus aureus]CAC5906073.1 Magnesium and cobalt transport protein corA [Staphylococcus aureus]
MALKIRYQTTYEPFKVVDDIKEIPKDATIVWYDFDEPNEQENEWFKAHFNFNDLEVDDAINGMPRAKYKSYKDYQYLVFHSIMGSNYSPIALNIFIQDNVLVTYHHQTLESLNKVVYKYMNTLDAELDCADVVILILDMMVDKYFNFVYALEDSVYHFEDRHVDDRFNKMVMDSVFKLRSDLIKVKRVLFPMQELIDTMKQNGDLIIDNKHSLYIQHIDDHLIKQRNIIRTAQEMTNEIRENFESYTSFRMNSIMQVLTLVSVIFSPLTFIAGIYGMNFVNMPALHLHYGYYICLAVMFVIAFVLIIFFRRKKWF